MQFLLFHELFFERDTSHNCHWSDFSFHCTIAVNLLTQLLHSVTCDNGSWTWIYNFTFIQIQLNVPHWFTQAATLSHLQWKNEWPGGQGESKKKNLFKVNCYFTIWSKDWSLNSLVLDTGSTLNFRRIGMNLAIFYILHVVFQWQMWSNLILG